MVKQGNIIIIDFDPQFTGKIKIRKYYSTKKGASLNEFA